MLCQGGDWSGEQTFIFKRGKSMISVMWGQGRNLGTLLGHGNNVDYTG